MQHLRVISINLCSENPTKKTVLVDKWITIFTKIRADIIFLQEINGYNLDKIIKKLNMQLLCINKSEHTCVLVKSQFTIINTKRIKFGTKIIYIGNIHLDDIPSIAHHINNMIYISSEIIPLSYSLDKLLKLSAKRRLPRIKQELKQIKKNDIAIVAGDFNEPSHLDSIIYTPVSVEFEKRGFIDTYRYANKSKGYTWPTHNFYKGEPAQRIDIIYSTGIKILSSKTYSTKEWLSDHKMVITNFIC